jgi:serine protease inhibitor
MLRRIATCMIILILPVVLLTSAGIRENTNTTSVDLMQEMTPSLEIKEGEIPTSNAVQAINEFSYRLLEQSLVNKGNILVSPASVYLALGMTLNGAQGATANAMTSVLGGAQMDVQDINTASRAWMYNLSSKSPDTTIAIANSIWFDQDYDPSSRFLQTNADYFRAGIHKLDFALKNASTIINNWVNEATRGTIEKVIDDIAPDMKMFLINSVYFKSDWQSQFDANSTRDRLFTTPKGPITTPFMHRTGRMLYLQTSDATGVALPYEDTNFMFFALLPQGDVTPRQWVTQNEGSNILQNIATIIDDSKLTQVELALPKFESRYEDSLVTDLRNMGMGIAFDANQADFSGMSAMQQRDLFIDEILHKTFIRVDEKGTEASAVTVVMMRATSMPMQGVRLTFDRPFVYGILDMNTTLPLFLGIMEHPEAP